MKYPYDKRIYTKHLREPLQSFNAFNIWIQHPNWTLKKLSKETGINYNKIATWSSKYHYFERRANKEADEWKQINKLALEAKMANIEYSSSRSLKLQGALNARAEITYNKNVEALQKLKTAGISNFELREIDKHTQATYDIENKNINNNLSLEQLINTIEFNTEKTNNEFTRLSNILVESRKRAEKREALKDDE